MNRIKPNTQEEPTEDYPEIELSSTEIITHYKHKRIAKIILSQVDEIIDEIQTMLERLCYHDCKTCEYQHLCMIKEI